MNKIDPQQILNQIRELRTELNSSMSPTVDAPGRASEVSSFGALLKSAITDVNSAQQTAGDLKRSYEAEDPDTDLTEVMIAVQKADLSFRAMTEVRNKLVDAYQTIMNMPV